MSVINVIGLGYIGLPTALMLSHAGNKVIGSDIDEERIRLLSNAKCEFLEEGIKDLYQSAIKNGIEFSKNPISADIYIIAVPTPYDKRTRRIIPEYLLAAINSIVSLCKKESIIVVESTISPGTIEKELQPIIDKENSLRGKKISICHAPERIIPGSIVHELKHNSRIIGADNKDVGKIIKNIYATFCDGNIILTDIKTAELSKVAENTYRDINIAYANELVKICKEANVDVYELIKLANMHPRVNILSPGPGVGGHCISVDPWFLVGDYPEIANLILIARRVNDSMPDFVAKRISEIMLKHRIDDVKDIGLYGLTYKENIDDVRESPTLQLIKCMESHGAIGIKAYDPYVTKDIVNNQYHDLKKFLGDIKLVVVMVGHDEIINNQDKLKNHIIYDTRNVLDIEKKYKL